MKTHRKAYQGFRFPGEVISHGVWLYHRFTLSFRDVEELLAERGIAVTHESIPKLVETGATSVSGDSM